MKRTIRLADDLLALIKQLAARSDKTLTSVIEDALPEMLVRQQETEERAPVGLTTVLGHGLQPGVDLDDSADLLYLMDNSCDPV